ncbi:hypothetical protein GTCCBUS3UF5_28610 [Geobacillus thermoleovorans CCB_US3_UF5]|uniref:Uncharacterized protein n=2 Tax=Geobacillus thermoleovorans group TaxID=1505648 RepID=U2Y7L4_GEOKU|nr:hypothetical protein GTCCBUS3UF5_28610 [Geobacillus thermoleovorans CCB_US3_UF5]GAD12608.1 hypothetical protein GBL_0825 [Geobacillus kaustophilus GBlys]GAJ58086.1 hypothetical protein B23_1292 [Geobacillus thermoleovorans B23]
MPAVLRKKKSGSNRKPAFWPKGGFLFSHHAGVQGKASFLPILQKNGLQWK